MTCIAPSEGKLLKKIPTGNVHKLHKIMMCTEPDWIQKIKVGAINYELSGLMSNMSNQDQMPNLQAKLKP